MIFMHSLHDIRLKIGLFSIVIVLPVIAYACGIPDMEIIKTLDGNPSIVNVGDILSYSVRIHTKTSQAAATQVLITDTPSAGLEFIPNPINISDAYSCFRIIPGYGVACYIEGPITDTTVKLRFRVTEAARCATVTNTVHIEEMNEPDPNLSNNTSTFSVQGRCLDPEITLEKKIITGVSPVKAGDRIVYQLRVRNLDPFERVTNINIWDDKPAGLSYDAGQSSPYCSEEGSKIHCTFPEIPKNGSSVFRLEFRVHASVVFPNAVCSNGIDNSAYVTADNADRADSENVHLDVSCLEPNIVIKKEEQQSTVIPGSTVTYKVTIENKGAGPSQHVEFFDTIPLSNQKMTFLSDSLGICTGNSQSVYCNIGAVAAGEKITLNVVFTISSSAPCGTTFTNGLVAHVIYKDDVTASSGPITITCLAPSINAVKSADKSTIEPGNTIIYTIRVNNVGDGPARDIVVEDLIPANLTFVPSGTGSATDARCTKEGSAIRCRIPEITADDHDQVRLQFTFSL